MEWSEPILVEHELHVGPMRRPVFARLGFPRQIADDEWWCSFQVVGTGDKRRELGHGKIGRAISIDGLNALWNACYPIRYLLDRLRYVHASDTPHEFVFPVFLPTSDTRRGWDFYREVAHVLRVESKKSILGESDPTPPSKQLARSHWSEPALFEKRFELGPQKQEIYVRLGFPYFLSGENTWACSFQLEGPDGGAIHRVCGKNGVMAVAKATKVIRASLDAMDPQSLEAHYELIFPAYLPTTHGLDLHRRLHKLLNSERRRNLRNLLRRWKKRSDKQGKRDGRKRSGKSR